MCKQLRFSIRKINEDEIEIRNSFFDGYTRGFIRLLFIGIFCMSWYQNAKYKQPPFSYEIAAIKEDFVWTFNKKSIIKPLYEDHVKDHNDPEFIKMFPNNKLLSYEEYEKLYTDKPWAKWHIIRTFLHPIWMTFLLFLFCLPRPRGIRVNRKKRIIYAPILNGTYRIAFVPKEGDPLGGVVYSCYGPHPWGGDSLYSFVMAIREEKNMLPSRHYLGVYPSVTSKQSIDILNAIRAYLTEDNPEFLNTSNPVLAYGITSPPSRFATLLPFLCRLTEVKLMRRLKKLSQNGIKKRIIKNKNGLKI